jgi:hypothetical protein
MTDTTRLDAIRARYPVTGDDLPLALGDDARVSDDLCWLISALDAALSRAAAAARERDEARAAEARAMAERDITRAKLAGAEAVAAAVEASCGGRPDIIYTRGFEAGMAEAEASASRGWSTADEMHVTIGQLRNALAQARNEGAAAALREAAEAFRYQAGKEESGAAWDAWVNAAEHCEALATRYASPAVTEQAAPEPANVCGKRCDQGSECLKIAGHEGGHETQHGCIFYDLIGRWDADIAALISTHSTGPARDGVQTVRVRPLVDVLVGLPPVCPACGAACSGEGSGA